MVCSRRAEGPVLERNNHDVPFHSQVSPFTDGPPFGLPPKSTVTPRALSYAIATWSRADGPEVARNVHEPPFHSHVSPSSFAPPSGDPPNSAATLRPAS